MAVNSRNFKTSETERKIDRNTPDTEEVNAKLQEYVDQIKVSRSLRYGRGEQFSSLSGFCKLTGCCCFFRGKQ